MSEQVVVVELRNRSMWLRLNRPEAMNSLSPQVLSALRTALGQARHNDEVVSVVLTGTGRAFCAGADLKYVRSQANGGGTEEFLQGVLEIMDLLENFPKPVIASINGLALAGGLELVLCCDLVVAARSAKIGDAHGNYGLLPGGGSSVRLPRLIGATRAKHLLFTAEFLDAQKLMDAGLVNEVVDDDKLEEATQALADKLALRSPLVLRRMKALIDDGLEQPKTTALRLELLASEVHCHSADFREGLAAFEQKRKPRFIGR